LVFVDIYNMSCIENMSPPADGTIAQTHPSIISVDPRVTLRRLYPRTFFSSGVRGPLVQFPPLTGPCSNLLEHPDVNDPNFIDLGFRVREF
jgi:hypothetical protein